MSTLNPSAFGALSAANAKEWSRDRVGMLFSFAFPLVILLVFGTLYHGDSYQGRPYIDTIAPGVLCWAIASSAMFGVAYSVMGSRTSDLLRLVRMTPVSLPTILGAQFVVSVASAAVQAVVFLGIALVPFLGLHLAPSAFAVVVPLLVGTATFFALGIVIGTYAGTPDAVTAIGNVLVLPMVFLSGTVYPVSSMPRWMQDATQILPLRHMIEGVSGVASGTEPAWHAFSQAGILVAFFVVFAAVAARVFRWSVAK